MSGTNQKSGLPFIYDDNGRIVGTKDPDGGEYYFPRHSTAAAAANAASLVSPTGGEAGLTAHAGGTKAAALALDATKTAHHVTTVGTTADSVLMPAATAGAMHFVRNDGANAMQVFGAGNDTINGVVTATGISMAAATGKLFVCLTAGAWVTT